MTDLVVIGGGIQGADVAREAALRGWNVLVLETAFVGSGTSSKSTGLIHGGLRYLEHGEFGLVRESLRARQELLNDYPDLVLNTRFLLPVYKSSTRPSWKIKLGLSLYSFLAGNGWKVEQIRKGQMGHLAFTDEDLQAVYAYEDARVDDRALTHRVMQEAIDAGAEVHERCKVTAIKKFTTATGYTVEWQDRTMLEMANSPSELKRYAGAPYVINAAGPWANDVLDLVDAEQKVRQLEVNLVKGSHIVLDVGYRPTLGFYLEHPEDNRPIFVVPRQGPDGQDQIIVGTTEISWEGNPDNVEPSEAEIEYLLKAYNHYFPNKKATQKNIFSSWAGLRVLPKIGLDGNVQRLSREVMFETDTDRNPQLLTIYGGKLTVHRSTAKKALNILGLGNKNE